MSDKATCEYGYPEMCGKPAVYVGHMPKYPANLYACEVHRLPMFGSLAVDSDKYGAKLRYEDYERLTRQYGGYSRVVRENSHERV